MASLFFAPFGCDSFSSFSTEYGYVEAHYYSCGPKTLSKVLNRFDMKMSMPEISREIQDHARKNLPYRKHVSKLYSNLGAMTFPSEMISMLERKGLQVKEANYYDLKEGDVAIVLLTNGLIYHWMPYPDGHEIDNYFDRNNAGHTYIVVTYIITKG